MPIFTSCIICKSVITTANINKHYKSKTCLTGSKQICLPKPKSFNCTYCGSLRKNINSFRNHELTCTENFDRKLSSGNLNKKGQKSWNKGLTKHTDTRVAKGALNLANNGKFKNNKGKHITKRKSGWKRKNTFYHYNGFKFQSSYEYRLAIILDELNITWHKPKKQNYTSITGESHYYTADFYLPDYKLYLDPKNDFLIHNINPTFGYKDTDKIKWVMEQNNVQIEILSLSLISKNYVILLLT